MRAPVASTCAERIMETMIELASVSKSHRVIVTGSDSLEIYLGLCRRGYLRVATTATCRMPCGQHDVGLVAGQHSIQALEAILVRIVHFLNTASALAVWIGSHEDGHARRLRVLLERLGFRIEAATQCEQGYVLSARRREASHLLRAA
jgi:hypothetical protein